jgi:hypothetical protein
MLELDGKSEILFLQVEGTFRRRSAPLDSEVDLSGGCWFESSRRSKSAGQGFGQ